VVNRAPQMVVNSRQQLADDFPVHIRQPEVPTLALVGQPLVIDAQAMQHRRLQIVHVHRIGHHVVANNRRSRRC
jgi:hypothetical protein